MWALFALVAPAAEPLPCTITHAIAVETSLSDVWSSFDRVDSGAFDHAAHQLKQATSCLREPLTPAQIARVHQAMALVALVEGHPDATRRALRASRMLDPGWTPGQPRFQFSHPYRSLWRQSALPHSATLTRRAAQGWAIDGLAGAGVPQDRAFFLQVEGSTGIVWSRYVWSHEELATAPPPRAKAPPRVLANATLFHAHRQTSPAATGLAFDARFTPNGWTAISVEAVGASDGTLEQQLVWSLGPSPVAGISQAWQLMARLGGAVVRLPAHATAAPIDTLAWIAGGEAAYVTQRSRADASADAWMGPRAQPLQARIRASYRWRIASPWAVGIAAALHRGRIAASPSTGGIAVRTGAVIGYWR